MSGESEPYRDPLQPGRIDVNGNEWWACDPYPTWYRWANGFLYTSPASWIPDDSEAARRKARRLEERAEQYEAKAQKLRDQARRVIENVKEETSE